MKYSNYIFALPCAVMASTASHAAGHTQWPNSTTVYYPDSDAFVNATARWNAYGAPDYSAAVSPSSVAEMIEIVGPFQVES